MSNKTPLFLTQQGSLKTSNLNYVSTLRDHFLRGEIDPETIDIHVNINEQGFSSSPSLVLFDQGSFQIPNPNVYPEGLRLGFGINTIQVKAIDLLGNASPEAFASINVLRPEDVTIPVTAPSGLSVLRRRDSIELSWAQNDSSPYIRGYNVYCSREEGGGVSGYVKINADLITNPSYQEDNSRLLSEDASIYSKQYNQLRVLMTEEDEFDVPQRIVSEYTLDVTNSEDDIKITTKVESIVKTTYFTFRHHREGSLQEGFINNESFADVPMEEPLFYVITSVYFNPETNLELESYYSSELVGLPLIINTQIKEIPRRTRLDVSEDYIKKILSYDNEISIIPGSVVRDVFIDPFATEAERLYFLTDFVRRSQSLSTLLLVDGSDSYKEALGAALGVNSLSTVQDLIDDTFDKLASDVNVTRLGALEAVGSVIFYTTKEPLSNITITEGTLVSVESGPSFRVTSRVTLDVSRKESYYNFQRRRWEIRAPIRCTLPGLQGNVPAGKIRRVVGISSGIQVTNLEATSFGRSEESNQSLAERAILAFSSVDVGTESGYLASALKHVGVFRAKVIKAGDEYMERDYDEIRHKNIGGKVDLWIQGDKRVQVSDSFALKFEITRGASFLLDSNPADLIFIVNDPDVTPMNPIHTLLGETPEEIALGFAFKNITTGMNFDLSGYKILSYNRIQLNTSIPQPAIHPNDIVTGDFRFRISNDFVLSRQPVIQIDSFRSLNSNTELEEGVHFNLFRTQDPLLEGMSAKSSDFVRITGVGGIPSGNLFRVTNESHILVGEIPEALNMLGASPYSVRVFNLDRSVEYNGPNHASPDFLIEAGSETSPLKIIRVPQSGGGRIRIGEEVVVDYDHDENFEIEYVNNQIISDLQEEIEVKRHITADVLVKQAIANRIDLEMTIVLDHGADQSQTDSNVRTAISQYMNSRPIGKEIHQSDIVQAIENTMGVNYVVVPFAKMTHANGNLIAREKLTNAFDQVDQTASIRVFILKEGLKYNTSNRGGQELLHRGVFQDGFVMTESSSLAQLRLTKNSAFIIGKEGLVIPGYSDNTTLEAEGYNTLERKDKRRKELTANHILVALDIADTPLNHKYTVSYITEGDDNSQSTISLSDINHAELGDLTITYRGGSLG